MLMNNIILTLCALFISWNSLQASEDIILDKQGAYQIFLENYDDKYLSDNSIRYVVVVENNFFIVAKVSLITKQTKIILILDISE